MCFHNIIFIILLNLRRQEFPSFELFIFAQSLILCGSNLVHTWSEDDVCQAHRVLVHGVVHRAGRTEWTLIYITGLQDCYSYFSLLRGRHQTFVGSGQRRDYAELPFSCTSTTRGARIVRSSPTVAAVAMPTALTLTRSVCPLAAMIGKIMAMKMWYYYNLARRTMEIVLPEGQLFHLRGALSCLRDAIDRRSRRPEGEIMWPEGSCNNNILI